MPSFSLTEDFVSPFASTSATLGIFVKNSITFEGVFVVARMSMSPIVSFILLVEPAMLALSTSFSVFSMLIISSALLNAKPKGTLSLVFLANSMLFSMLCSTVGPNPFISCILPCFAAFSSSATFLTFNSL